MLEEACKETWKKDKCRKLLPLYCVLVIEGLLAWLVTKLCNLLILSMKFCDTLWISIIFRASKGGTYVVQDTIYLKISVTII